MRFIILTILLASTIWSCGSRKVEIKKYNSDVVLVDSLKLKATLETLQLENRLYKSLIKNLNFRADSIVLSTKGALGIYNPILNTDVIQEEVVESTFLQSAEEFNLDSGKKLDIEDESFEKNLERESLSFLNYITLFGLLVALVILLRKLYKTIAKRY